MSADFVTVHRVTLGQRMRAGASLGLLTVAIMAGCGTRENPAGILPNQSSFLIRFGAADTVPANWSGSVETGGGRVVSLAPWHFDKEDRFDQQPNTWTCSTRLGAVLDPKFWWLGALHTVPTDNTIPKYAAGSERIVRHS